MNESEKQKRADARKKRKRRQMFIGRMIIVILLFIILGLCAFLGKDMLEKKKLRDNRDTSLNHGLSCRRFVSHLVNDLS